MSKSGHLSARPKTPKSAGPTGLFPLGLDPKRDSYLFVPDTYAPDSPVPLILLLHGAGGHAHHGLAPLQDMATKEGLILLAPASRAATWDVIVGQYGPDVRLIESALSFVFTRYAVDPERVVIGGFSDGASYALSLGLTNGDLFRQIIAFSPGFMAPAAQRGKPQIFISHGDKDTILPINNCSRRIVPQLRRAGYSVDYHEFNGGHVVPPDIAQSSIKWLKNNAALVHDVDLMEQH